MKKLVVLALSLLLVSGCTNGLEKDKNNYLTYKNDLQEKDVFEDTEKLDFNSYFDIYRENEEKIVYSMVIDDAKVDMYKVKALLIHDYFTEDVFPSVGIFDEPRTLLSNSDDKITLEGSISTDDSIIDTKFKLYLEYEDSNGEKNTIYYEVPRG